MRLAVEDTVATSTDTCPVTADVRLVNVLAADVDLGHGNGGCAGTADVSDPGGESRWA